MHLVEHHGRPGGGGPGEVEDGGDDGVDYLRRWGVEEALLRVEVHLRRRGVTRGHEGSREVTRGHAR